MLVKFFWHKGGCSIKECREINIYDEPEKEDSFDLFKGAYHVYGSGDPKGMYKRVDIRIPDGEWVTVFYSGPAYLMNDKGDTINTL